MKEFVIRCADGDAELYFSGEIPRGLIDYDECNFVVCLNSKSLSAKAIVYDIQPQHWADFFDDLAKNWRGWQGEKSQESLEGDLRIAATSDSLGHISLNITLRKNATGFNWKVETIFMVEAGQLDSIAVQAKQFFD